MKKFYEDLKPYLYLTLALVFAGQVLFALFSKPYTTPRYENKIFFTTGIVFDGSDLHKLNEGAHYFGQTMIGWTKFPNFRNNLIEALALPEDTGVNMHVQERQNMIFTLATDAPIDLEQLKQTKNYLEKQIDEYNKNTNTQFVMTNVDLQQVEVKKSYSFGALTTLVLSVMLSLAIVFVREIFFPPKLKF